MLKIWAKLVLYCDEMAWALCDGVAWGGLTPIEANIQVSGLSTITEIIYPTDLSHVRDS